MRTQDTFRSLLASSREQGGAAGWEGEGEEGEELTWSAVSIAHKVGLLVRGYMLAKRAVSGGGCMQAMLRVGERGWSVGSRSPSGASGC